ncbi:hypothetical protein GQ457_15G009230 [Hibiscus cannabinus]
MFREADSSSSSEGRLLKVVFVGNTLISIYIKSGKMDDSRYIPMRIHFGQLRCVLLDNYTWEEQGRGIYSLACKSEFHQVCFVETAVIDLYCKCGSIGGSERAFSYASADDLAAWNVMITGYAQHGGLLREAQSYMNSMVDCQGLFPHLEHYACMVDLLGREDHR